MTAQGSAIDDAHCAGAPADHGHRRAGRGRDGAAIVYLAGTIAEPMRRLAIAADRVRKNIKNREQIPDFSDRPDEIGNLSSALRDMTNALYSRLDAIESFAADVSHELKNPLTSLRNAASLLPSIKAEDDRKKLVDIINHDVRRLDRLITDISDASRLDAELARETARPVNIASLLGTLCEIMRENRIAAGLNIVLSVQGYSTPEQYAKRQGLCRERSRQPAGPSRREPDRERHIVLSEGRIDLCFREEAARRTTRSKSASRTRAPESGTRTSKRYSSASTPTVPNRSATIRGSASTSPSRSSGRTRERSGRRTGSVPGLRLPRPRKLKKQKGAAARPCPPPVCGKEEVFACGVMERYSYGSRFVIRLPACAGV